MYLEETKIARSRVGMLISDWFDKLKFLCGSGFQSISGFSLQINTLNNNTINLGSNREAIVAHVEKLFNIWSSSSLDVLASGDSNPVFLQIAKFLSELSQSIPQISDIIIHSLSEIRNPLPLIEVVPYLLSRSSDVSIELALLQLQRIAEADSSLIVPVVAAMSNISVPSKSVNVIIEVSQNALSACSENDFPFLIRNILKGLSVTLISQSENSLLKKTREEISYMPDNVLTIIVEILLEVLPTSYELTEAFLDEISNNIDQVSKLDTIVILIVYTDLFSLVHKCYPILTQWVKSKSIPFDHFTYILDTRKNNEVWGRLYQGIWRTAVSLIELRSFRENRSYDNSLIELIQKLFRECPSMQEPIIKTILGLSLPSQFNCHFNASNLVPLVNGSNKNEGAKKLSGKQTSLISTESIDKSLFALSILVYLKDIRGDIGNLMLSSLTERLQCDSSQSVMLPHPLILNKLLWNISNASESLPEIESTLLIIVNKLLVTVTDPNVHILSMMSSITNKSKDRFVTRPSMLHQVEKRMKCDHNNRFGIFSLNTSYNIRSVAFMLTREFSTRLNLKSYKDVCSLLCNIERALVLSRDDSIFYAIETLACIKLQLSKHLGSTIPHKFSTSSSSSSILSAEDPSNHDVFTQKSVINVCNRIFNKCIEEIKYYRDSDIAPNDIVCLRLSHAATKKPVKYRVWQLSRVGDYIASAISNELNDQINTQSYSFFSIIQQICWGFFHSAAFSADAMNNQNASLCISFMLQYSNEVQSPQIHESTESSLLAWIQSPSSIFISSNEFLDRNTMIVYIRRSWEHALCASVLIGYYTSNNYLKLGSQDLIQWLLRNIVCQLTLSRFYSEEFSRQRFYKKESHSSLSSRGESSNRLRGDKILLSTPGNKRKRSRIEDDDNLEDQDNKDDESESDEEVNNSQTIHRVSQKYYFKLRNYIDRLQNMISIKDLIDLVCCYRQGEKNDLDLLSDSGLAGLMLISDIVDKHEYVTDNINGEYQTCLNSKYIELVADTNYVPQLETLADLNSDIPVDSLRALVNLFIHAIPCIIERLNYLRKSESTGNASSEFDVQSEIGRPLSFQGCCLLLGFAFKILYRISKWQNEMSGAEFILTDQMRLQLYVMIESAISQLQDSSLVLGCLRFLEVFLCNTTILSSRFCVIGWNMLRSVYPTSLINALSKQSTHVSSAQPYSDSLASYLSYISDVSQPLIKVRNKKIEKEVLRYMTSVFKIPLNKDKFEMKYSSEGCLEQEYDLLFLSWLTSESDDARSLGLSFLLKEFFRSIENVDDVTSADSSSTNSNSAHTLTDSPEQRGMKSSGIALPSKKVTKTSTISNKSNLVNRVMNTQSSGQRKKRAIQSQSIRQFKVALSALPYILLSCNPKQPDASSYTANIAAPDDSASPYDSFITTVKIFIWTLKNIETANLSSLLDRKNMSTICSLVVKVCRITMQVVHEGIDNMIRWRSSYKLRFEEVIIDESNGAVPNIDWGSLDYLADALQWTRELLQSITLCMKYIQSSFILYQKKKSASTVGVLGLVGSCNSIINLSVKALSKVNKTASMHGLSSTNSRVSSEVKLTGKDWDKITKAKVSNFIRNKSQALHSEVSIEMMACARDRGLLRNRQNESRAEEIEDEVYDDEYSDHNSDEELESFEVHPSSSSAGGWGLYPTREESLY